MWLPTLSGRAKAIIVIIVICLVLLNAYANMPHQEIEPGKELTVDLIYDSPELSINSSISVQWVPNEDAITYCKVDLQTETQFIWRYDLKEQTKEILIDSKNISVLEEPETEAHFALQNYLWSPMEKKILLPSSTDLYLYDIPSGSVRRLTNDEEAEIDPQFSPDGKKIAFVKNHNIHVLDVESCTDMQLTTHGREHVLVGQLDWVYGEEFGIETGLFWAPDSQQIAFLQLDETVVPEFPIVDFFPIHNQFQSMRYPKAGDNNSIVRVGVVSLENQGIEWIDIGSETDIYVPRIKWLPDSKNLAIYRLNRPQNILELFFAEIKSGQTRTILVEEESNGWIDVCDDLAFLKYEESFIWSSNRDGFKHLYLYDVDGKLIRQLTKGSWEIDKLIGVDEEKNLVYFTGRQEHVWERHLYSVQLKSEGSISRLSEQQGWHSVDMDPTFQYYLDFFSDFTTPPEVSLHTSDGQLVNIIEASEVEAFKEHSLSQPEFFSFDTANNVTLNAFMIKPPDFDSSKKYPALIYVYGGPGSQVVINAWDTDSRRRHLWHQMMAQKGYVIFAVDNRGTGARGKEWMETVCWNLSNFEVQDQIAGVEYLHGLAYVDNTRIGIWGWSYGGYLTLMCMLKGSDYFKVGVAVSPPTDWRNYDTIYTERYMGKPHDNPQGYNTSSAITYAENLKGKLLLIHGSSDDNVHLSNTIQLTRAFQKARIPFDLMIYPGELHHIDDPDARIHLFNLITSYILNNL